ncbi:haloacid dehalogenase [Poronia punctata]|nr:haloacid dehalogenase [Poronia punctata]
MPTKKKKIAFDLYGTLLSTESISSKISPFLFPDNKVKEKATSIASQWRRYQLEYTWRMNSMGKYIPFSEITRKALVHAAIEHDMVFSSTEKDELMQAYDSLHVFPDVPAAVKQIAEAEVDAYIFSNGTAEMVGNSVKTSPELGGRMGLFKGFVSVDDVKCFKPDPKTYEHLVKETGKGKGEEEGDVWVVSANAFDVVGARAFGLKAVFIDRVGRGWVDGLDGDNDNDDDDDDGGGGGQERGGLVVVRGVDEAVKAILEYEDSN